jgi:16S rRNA (guanine966-N2)-methyltransferase
MPALRVTAGTLRGRRVPVPPRGVRPTSERARQAYFNIAGGRIAGARFLDLFSGSGIFSFEAVSRGAASATAIEQDKKYAAAIERLAEEWQAPVTVMARDVFTALPRLEGPFDLVYADPPYDFGRYDELIEALDKLPLSDGALVTIEHRRGVPIVARNAPTMSREYGEVSLTFFGR